MGIKRIILLATDCPATRYVYHALQDVFPIATVVLEKPQAKRQLLKRRIHKLGLFHVLDQVLFRVLAVPVLRRLSRERCRELHKLYSLDDRPIDPSRIVHVSSVNAEETEQLLRQLGPDIVILSGTRIVAPRILNCISAPFLNMHMGITPSYRGSHGAYWALTERDQQRCGVTVHLVDPGIDTGGILQQGTIEPGPNDTYITYPLLQMGVGIELLKKALTDLTAGCLQIKPYPPGSSRLWYGPTLMEYLKHRIRLGVK